MAGRLDGRVAVITGGGSGIGRACAELLASEGADVAIGDIRPCEETIDRIEEHGRRGIVVHTDTRHAEECEALVATATAEFGRVDVGVAAAGRTTAQYVSGQAPAPGERELEPRLIVNAPLADWDAVLDVNLRGVIQTDRALARQMLAQGTGGAIINIASTLARIPMPGSGPYCVSKAAVEMLTKVLALELAPHEIRVNAVGPTYTETPMTEGLRADEHALRDAIARVPLGRLGRPEEVAAAVLFLASDDASFFTGQTLFPGGGHYMG